MNELGGIDGFVATYAGGTYSSMPNTERPKSISKGRTTGSGLPSRTTVLSLHTMLAKAIHSRSRSNKRAEEGKKSLVGSL